MLERCKLFVAYIRRMNERLCAASGGLSDDKEPCSDLARLGEERGRGRPYAV